MRKSPRRAQQQEPIGIVISSGASEESLPLFRAYVWGPAPDADDAVETKAA